MSNVLKFPTGMAHMLRLAAQSPTTDQPTTYGFDYGTSVVPTGYADSLAHGIDFDTPGASFLGVALGYAHDQLAAQAQAEFAAGGHTLH